MATFPPLTHVALTVRDLSVSVPWYEALFDAEPVIDEDTDPDMHHTVYLLGNGTLIGLHEHGTRAPKEQFSEYRVGLDHVAFGCAERAELEKWSRRLDELGVDHGDVRVRPQLPRPRQHRPRVLRPAGVTGPKAPGERGSPGAFPTISV
jgi:catechol 2,3-dioxygenase-like lactoylglutathione lyase family enzyme